MSQNQATPTREQADAEFRQILRDAEQGRLGPVDFKRADELHPYVSPELLDPRGDR